MDKKQKCCSWYQHYPKRAWKNMRWSLFVFGVGILHVHADSRPSDKSNLSPNGRSVELSKKGIEERTTFYDNGNQENDIGGLVTNSKNEPIPGVTIVVKGSSNRTITNAEGRFVLKGVSDDATLVFSSIGMKTQEIQGRGNRNFNVILEEGSTEMDEVVVIGYGSQRKATVTGAVSTISGETIAQSPSVNLSNNIVGRMTGVIANNRTGEPGSDYSSILIRGKATLGNNSPLYVIDGVANRGNLERLNPADIESVSILKDASAAIYGAQAANGVILITTKRGVEGKPTISYQGDFGLTQATRLPHLMDAYQYMVYQDEARGFEGKSLLYEGVKEKYLSGDIDNITLANTDWMGVLFRDFAPQTQHSLSVRGGNDRVKYFVSGANVYQEPLFKSTVGNDYKSAQVRANIDARITDNLTVNLDLMGRREVRDQSDYGSEKIFSEAFNVYPYVPAFYPNGLVTAGISKGLNPAILSTGETGYYKNTDYFANAQVGFDLKLPWVTEGLSVSGYYAYDVHPGKEKTFHNKWDAYQYVMNDDGDIVGYDNIRNQTNEYGTISLNQAAYDSDLYTSNLKLSYEKNIGQHSISIFAAVEQSKSRSESLSAYRRDYLSDQIQLISAGSNELKDNSGSAGHSSRQNYFSRLSYDYGDKYLATFTIRRDGSSNFPPDKRWGTFPALSVGWRLSEESFIKDNLNFVNDFKIRASWGKLGNDRTAAFQYLSTFNLVNGGIFGENFVTRQGFNEGVTPNTNITWETIDSKNIGIDGSLWNGRLSFDFNYFNADRTGILIRKNASIPEYTGFSLSDQNLGQVSNRGVEIELNHRDQIGQVSYYIGGNMTFARNKVVYMDEAADVPAWQKREGHPIDSWLVYPTDGIYQTMEEVNSSPHLAGQQPGEVKYVDTDDDGSITGKDMIRIFKSPTPELIFGFPMGASWNGFDLNLLWQGQAMAKQFLLPQSLNLDVDYFNNRWISAGETPNAKYPRAYTYEYPTLDQMLEFWLRDASFIRLKNAELAYNFKSKVLKRMKIANLRVHVSGANLLTFDRMKLVDPELNPGNFGGKYYPQTRIYNVGVNLSL